MSKEVITSIEQVSQNFDAVKTHKFQWLLLIILATALTGSAQPVSPQRDKRTVNQPRVSAEVGTSQTIMQRCAEAVPDASYLIPGSNQFGERTEASGSGAYAYKPAGDCRYWVVDFLLDQNSTHPGGVVFWTSSFDLPSSAPDDDKRPSVKEDCERVELDFFIYRKEPNEPKFKVIQSHSRRGYWQAGLCMYGGSDLVGARAPTSGVLKIRIAVRVKLRGSWQQVAAHASLPPPS
jgi:hypothetical protein